MKIGDKVWWFDETRRVYVDDGGNRAHSPWYRGHFKEKFIIGETRQSWILSFDRNTHPKDGFKILKMNATKYIYNLGDAVNNACWVDANRYILSELVAKCNDYEKLLQIKQVLEGK